MSELVKAEPTGLDALWATVEREHAAAGIALKSALDHALAAGQALLEAQAAFTGDSFEREVEARGLSYRTAQRYMRIAAHQVELKLAPADLSLAQADMWLRGRPRRSTRDEEMVAEIERLHAQGLGARQIAKRLRIARDTVRYHLDPDYRAKKLGRRVVDQRKTRRGNRDEETVRRVQSQGGPIFDGYRLVCEARAELERALEAAKTASEQWDLRCAIDCLIETEDRIARAVRADLPVQQKTRIRSAHPDVVLGE